MNPITRRSLFGSLVAVAAGCFVGSVQVVRQWHRTLRRVPNGKEFGLSVEFSGNDLSDDNGAGLRRKLEAAVTSLHEALPVDHNLWRVGHAYIRFRTGRASSVEEWAQIHGDSNQVGKHG